MPADEGLRTFAAKIGAPPRRDEPEPDLCDDCGAFRLLRGRDRALMVAFYLKNGNVDAFSYSSLERVTYDPSEGITLTFGREKVTICGRNLDRECRPGMRLIDGILAHKVTSIREASRSAIQAAPTDALLIDRISFGV